MVTEMVTSKAILREEKVDLNVKIEQEKKAIKIKGTIDFLICRETLAETNVYSWMQLDVVK